MSRIDARTLLVTSTAITGSDPYNGTMPRSQHCPTATPGVGVLELAARIGVHPVERTSSTYTGKSSPHRCDVNRKEQHPMYRSIRSNSFAPAACSPVVVCRSCGYPMAGRHTDRATSFTHILAEALHRRLGIALTARRIPRCTTMPSLCTRYASALVPKR